MHQLFVADEVEVGRQALPVNKLLARRLLSEATMKKRMNDPHSSCNSLAKATVCFETVHIEGGSKIINSVTKNDAIASVQILKLREFAKLRWDGASELI